MPMTVRGRTCKAGTIRFSGSLSEVKQCPLGLDRCLRELLFGSAAGLLEGCSRTCSHDGEKNTWKMEEERSHPLILPNRVRTEAA